jgi:hypothetical protein
MVILAEVFVGFSLSIQARAGLCLDYLKIGALLPIPCPAISNLISHIVDTAPNKQTLQMQIQKEFYGKISCKSRYTGLENHSFALI